MADEFAGYDHPSERSSWQDPEDPRGWIEGGKRCAIAPGNLEKWWVGISPRNGYGAMVGGPWEDWLELARGILAADEAYRAWSAAQNHEAHR